MVFTSNMITTVIGAYPKPSYIKITDWFNSKGGTDTENPTKFYAEEIKKMGNKAEELFFKATNEIIKDQNALTKKIDNKIINELFY